MDVTVNVQYACKLHRCLCLQIIFMWPCVCTNYIYICWHFFFVCFFFIFIGWVCNDMLNVYVFLKNYPCSHVLMLAGFSTKKGQTRNSLTSSGPKRKNTHENWRKQKYNTPSPGRKQEEKKMERIKLPEFQTFICCCCCCLFPFVWLTIFIVWFCFRNCCCHKWCLALR